jgi:hypothetical protein
LRFSETHTDLVVGRLMVRQAVARGIIGTPKSGKPREIPLNAKVMRALKAREHRPRMVVAHPPGDDDLE